MLKLRDGVRELLRKAATSLPRDMQEALGAAYEAEPAQSLSKEALFYILDNIRIAKSGGLPICQDTGTPVFYVKAPKDLGFKAIGQSIVEAVREATEGVPLRPNAVDVLTEKNSGDNTGILYPEIYFEQSEENTLVIDLSLRGAGCENAGSFYRLPDERLGAERGLEGVRLCALDAIQRVQGRACPPYTVGIGIAGTRLVAASLSRKALLGRLNEPTEANSIAELESSILHDLNELGIGALGLGGRCTALGVKIKHAHRHTGSYFVDISVACWANRRGRLVW